MPNPNELSSHPRSRPSLPLRSGTRPRLLGVLFSGARTVRPCVRGVDARARVAQGQAARRRDARPPSPGGPPSVVGVPSPRPPALASRATANLHRTRARLLSDRCDGRQTPELLRGVRERHGAAPQSTTAADRSACASRRSPSLAPSPRALAHPPWRVDTLCCVSRVCQRAVARRASLHTALPFWRDPRFRVCAPRSGASPRPPPSAPPQWTHRVHP